MLTAVIERIKICESLALDEGDSMFSSQKDVGVRGWPLLLKCYLEVVLVESGPVKS